ncbi:MAG: pyridoxal phosphate-dependent aminotransferase [Kofleriaceae bacterium]
MSGDPFLPHPLARRDLQRVALPIHHTRYRAGITERLYTNPHGGPYAAYPCPLPTTLQAGYAAAIDALDRPRARHPQAARLEATHILMTAGTIMGIDLLIRAFCQPGADSIAIASPTFPPYASIATGFGVGVVDVPLAGDDLDRIDVERITAAGAKLTFLCTPNNPTSTSLDPADVLAVVARSRGLVVVDEAYIEFSRRYSLANIVMAHPNLVVLRTLSKAWGLAGLRAGVMIAQPAVLDTIRLVQDPFACSTPVQVEAARAFANLDAVRSALDRSIAERDAFVEALRALPAVARVYPSETNFVFCELRDHAELLARLDANPQLLAADVSNQRASCFKLSLGSPAENGELLAALAH